MSDHRCFTSRHPGTRYWQRCAYCVKLVTLEVAKWPSNTRRAPTTNQAQIAKQQAALCRYVLCICNIDVKRPMASIRVFVISLCFVVAVPRAVLAQQSERPGTNPGTNQDRTIVPSVPPPTGVLTGFGLGDNPLEPRAPRPLPIFGSSWPTSQQQQPPERTHTGLKALFVETGKDFAAFPRRRSTWVILAVGAGAAAAAHPADDAVNARLAGSDAVGRFFAPGKYIGAVYTQAGVAAGLYVVGRYILAPAEHEPRTNKVSEVGFDMFRAVIVSQVLTQAVKVSSQRDRPTGECCSFPSGHASAAFATASVLERHLGYRGAWPTFVIATYVATSRLHDNRHFLSDVVFGSALGIATGWTVVGRHGRPGLTVMPVPVRGGMMVTFVRIPAGAER